MKKINPVYLFVALATSAMVIGSITKDHNIFAFIGWTIAAIGYFTLTFRDCKK